MLLNSGRCFQKMDKGISEEKFNPTLYNFILIYLFPSIIFGEDDHTIHISQDIYHDNLQGFVSRIENNQSFLVFVHPERVASTLTLGHMLVLVMSGTGYQWN